MNWSVAGLCTSLLVAVFAWQRSRRPAGYYDGDVYGMTRATHRRYLAIVLLLAALFIWTWIARAEGAAVWLLALAVVIGVFYLTSFLRGWSEE